MRMLDAVIVHPPGSGLTLTRRRRPERLEARAVNETAEVEVTRQRVLLHVRELAAVGRTLNLRHNRSFHLQQLAPGETVEPPRV